MEFKWSLIMEFEWSVIGCEMVIKGEWFYYFYKEQYFIVLCTIDIDQETKQWQTFK